MGPVHGKRGGPARAPHAHPVQKREQLQRRAHAKRLRVRLHHQPAPGAHGVADTAQHLRQDPQGIHARGQREPQAEPRGLQGGLVAAGAAQGPHDPARGARGAPAAARGAVDWDWKVPLCHAGVPAGAKARLRGLGRGHAQDRGGLQRGCFLHRRLEGHGEGARREALGRGTEDNHSVRDAQGDLDHPHGVGLGRLARQRGVLRRRKAHSVVCARHGLKCFDHVGDAADGVPLQGVAKGWCGFTRE